MAPVIHEWTYEAMAYDLLNLEGGTFRYTAETGTGKETKEHVLSDKDELWNNLRHKFIAEVQRELADMTTAFTSKNKAAKYKVGMGWSVLFVQHKNGPHVVHAWRACLSCGHASGMQQCNGRAAI